MIPHTQEFLEKYDKNLKTYGLAAHPTGEFHFVEPYICQAKCVRTASMVGSSADRKQWEDWVKFTFL